MIVRSGRVRVTLLILVALLALGAAPASAAGWKPYVVVLEDSVEHPAATAQAQVGPGDGQIGFVYRHALKGYSATLSEAAVELLRKDPKVAYVSPDHRDRAFAQTTPTGVKRIFGPTNLQLSINGSDDERANVDVAVIDTGVEEKHPDLSVDELTDCVPPEKFKEPEVKKCEDGSATDETSHGTHVAGTIGAVDDGEGVVGVAPGARIWAVKVLADNGKGEGVGYESWILAGVDWVTSHAKEIEVANMSLGCGPLLDKEEKLKACVQKPLGEAITKSVKAGVVYVAAAGNSKVDVKYVSPANNPSVITVSAIADYDGAEGGTAEPTCQNKGADDTSYDLSNFGSLVDVTAPGVCILSTVTGGGYEEFTGTSMAAPHVAGAAAILASASNPETGADVEAIGATIVGSGNEEWKDTSGDGIKEPLLDVHDEGVFDLNG
jgi:subtilisin family serine protease